MVLSDMNFQLDILFEGPLTLLTLDDNQVGDEGLHHLHWLLFDGEVRTLLHRLLLDTGAVGAGRLPPLRRRAARPAFTIRRQLF